MTGWSVSHTFGVLVLLLAVQQASYLLGLFRLTTAPLSALYSDWPRGSFSPSGRVIGPQHRGDGLDQDPESRQSDHLRT